MGAISVAGFIRRCMHTTVLGGAVLGAVAGVGLLVGGIAGTTTTPTSAAGSTTPHLRFASFTEGPADVCVDRCRQLIVASGMITADTPRQFATFVNENSLQNTQSVVVLESDGGSVLGALDFGRAIRRFGFGTTVGRVVERRAKSGAAFGEVNTRADCQSMCTFVLLGGVERDVPRDARVLVHQIWLGDRRDDTVAASYTAEDLEVVQRDIGSIMQYTVEMGGDIELVALSLKVPPWEPMRALSRDELRRTRLIHAGETAESTIVKTAAGPASGEDSQFADINGRGWVTITQGGQLAIARTHPLTFEGERLGSFDIYIACGSAADTYALTYREIRSGSSERGLPRALTQVALTMDDQVQSLKVGSSERKARRGEIESIARTVLPARLVRTLAGDNPASFTLETESSGNPRTVTRVGNAGFGRSFKELDRSCREARRADMRDTRAQIVTRP